MRLCRVHGVGEAQEDVLQGDLADRVVIQLVLVPSLLQDAKHLGEGRGLRVWSRGGDAEGEWGLGCWDCHRNSGKGLTHRHRCLLFGNRPDRVPDLLCDPGLC